jgi:hypothetical protein
MRPTLAGLLAIGCLAPLAAQPKPAITPLPQSPTLTGPPTMGLQRGTTAEFTLPGTNLNDAVAVYTTAPGVTVTIPPNQSDATKLKVSLTAAADGPIGLFQLRVATKNGVSNFRPLCLDDLPEVAKTGDISKKDKAQVLVGPCVVTSTAAAEAADYYKVAVKPGQKLMLEVLARRIGSPTDPVIILHDSKTLRELPALYADDTPGLQGDCRLALPNKEAAEYIVEVRDMTYQGGPTFGYRMRVGEFPVATCAFPLARKIVATKPTTGPMPTPFQMAGDGLSNGFAGADLEGITASVENFGGVVEYISPRRAKGPRGWPVPVKLEHFMVSVEQEPNGSPETANPLPVPGGVSARFAKKGHKGHFRFDAKKGLKYAVEAMTGELGAPTEVYIRILDKAGKELIASDPQKVKANVEVTAAEDGPLVIACEHLLYLSGPNEVYFLTVKEVKPEIEVTLDSDRIQIPWGGIAPLAITGMNRLNGNTGPVEIDVVDTSARLMGQAKIPESFNPTPDRPFIVPVMNTSGPGFATNFTVLCRIPKSYTTAQSLGTLKAAFSNLTYTPLEMQYGCVEGVYRPKVKFTLPQDAITLKPGEKATVKVERSPKPAVPAANLAVAGGSAGAQTASDVSYTGIALPAGVTLTVKGDELTLTADAKAPAGTGRLVVRGQLVKPKGKEKDPDYAVYGIGGEITVQGEVIKDPPMKK